MTVLVVADHNHDSLGEATHKTVTAAQGLGGEIDILIAGDQIASLAEDARKLTGVRKILCAEGPGLQHQLAEAMDALILPLMESYDAVLAPTTSIGKNFMPRLAAKLDVMQISDVVAIEAPDVFVRPVYAGNALVTVRSRDEKKVITVRPTAFKAVEEGGHAELENLSAPPAPARVSFLGQELTKTDRPQLASAKIVVSGGRGLGSADNFKLVEALADKLGAAVGASRAAVDAGFAPNDWQVGQTGKVVAPDLYIALGISGAIQHVAGMKDSKVIVAINKDPDAPIFQLADYGLVGDVFKVIEELDAVLG